MCGCLHGQSLGTICVQFSQRPEGGVRPSGTGVVVGCDPPCGCWVKSSDPVEEQKAFFPDQPSHQPVKQCFKKLRAKKKKIKSIIDNKEHRVGRGKLMI